MPSLLGYPNSMVNICFILPSWPCASLLFSEMDSGLHWFPGFRRCLFTACQH